MARTGPETAPGAEYQKRKSRRGYQTLLALDPHDGGQWDLLVSDMTLDRVAREGMGKSKELVHVVRPVLLKPRALFRGVRDVENDIEDDHWLCYIGTPHDAYNYKIGNRVDAWRGEVLAVYVNEERVFYNWFWIKCDPAISHLPVAHEQRFREKVF